MEKEAKRIKKCLYVVGASTIVTGLSMVWALTEGCYYAGILNLFLLGFNIWAFRKVKGYLKGVENDNL